MMELEVSIQSYKSNFTLTLRNIQRGSHMQGKGRYILWHWLVLCISVFRLYLKLLFLRLQNCAKLTIEVFFGNVLWNVFRLWNHREGMPAFKISPFWFPLSRFLSPGWFYNCGFFRQGYFSYKVLGRKYTNVVFWLLSRLLSPFLR